MRKPLFPLFAALTLLPMSGCKAKPPEPVPVQGKLLDAKDQGFANVIVRLVPEKANDLKIDAVTRKDGSFTLKCRPGIYHITLMTIPTVGTVAIKPNQPARPLVKRDLEKKKEDNKEEEVNPEEEKKPKDERFADCYQEIAATPWRNMEISAKGPNELKLVVTKGNAAAKVSAPTPTVVTQAEFLPAPKDVGVFLPLYMVYVILGIVMGMLMLTFALGFVLGRRTLAAEDTTAIPPPA